MRIGYERNAWRNTVTFTCHDCGQKKEFRNHELKRPISKTWDHYCNLEVLGQEMKA